MLTFVPERKKLKKATSAATFEGKYATLIEVRKQLCSDRETLVEAEVKLPELRNTLVLKKKNFDKAEKNTVDARKEYTHVSYSKLTKGRIQIVE